MLIQIREEHPDDVAAVREVNRLAFGQEQESNIVEALRTNGGALLSLIATVNGQVAGHIMYSPLTVAENVQSVALGPMAVVPEYQRQGIGTQLIEGGNRKIKDAGYPFIIVVGHAQYYPGFGSRPAIESGIKWEWDISGRSFHVLVLNEAKMQGASGLAKYRHEFSTIS